MVFEKVREKLKQRAKERHERLLKQDKAKIEDLQEQEKLWKSAEGVEKERAKVTKIKSNISRMKEKSGGGFLSKIAKGAQAFGKGFDEVGKAIEPIGRGLDAAAGTFGDFGSPAPRRKHKKQKSKKKGRSRRRSVDAFDFGF